MITFRDMTFCNAGCINETCARRLTQEIVGKANAAEMPIAICDMHADCEYYQPREKEDGECQDNAE